MGGIKPPEYFLGFENMVKETRSKLKIFILECIALIVTIFLSALVVYVYSGGIFLVCNIVGLYFRSFFFDNGNLSPGGELSIVAAFYGMVLILSVASNLYVLFLIKVIHFDAKKI